MKKMLNFKKFLESVETLEVGYEADDKTSNTLSEVSLENLAKEIRDYKSLKSKVDNIITNANEDEDVSDKVKKVITDDKTYGTNRFLRMYASISHKKKQIDNLEKSIDSQNEKISEKEGTRSDVDRADREAMKTFENSLKGMKDKLEDSKKRIKDLEKEIKDKESEINKFMRDIEKDKEKSVRDDKWKASFKK